MYAVSDAATALPLKRQFPGVGLWPLLIAVQAIELLWVIFTYRRRRQHRRQRRPHSFGLVPYSHSVGSALALAGGAWLGTFAAGRGCCSKAHVGTQHGGRSHDSFERAFGSGGGPSPITGCAGLCAGAGSPRHPSGDRATGSGHRPLRPRHARRGPRTEATVRSRPRRQSAPMAVENPTGAGACALSYPPSLRSLRWAFPTCGSPAGYRLHSVVAIPH